MNDTVTFLLKILYVWVIWTFVSHFAIDFSNIYLWPNKFKLQKTYAIEVYGVINQL